MIYTTIKASERYDDRMLPFVSSSSPHLIHPVTARKGNVNR